jgi:hypothetical protein
MLCPFQVEESTSFCEQKEAKKLYFLCAPAVATRARSGAKVFWLFFSKKNIYLHPLVPPS